MENTIELFSWWEQSYSNKAAFYDFTIKQEYTPLLMEQAYSPSYLSCSITRGSSANEIEVNPYETRIDAPAKYDAGAITATDPQGDDSVFRFPLHHYDWPHFDDCGPDTHFDAETEYRLQARLELDQALGWSLFDTPLAERESNASDLVDASDVTPLFESSDVQQYGENAMLTEISNDAQGTFEFESSEHLIVLPRAAIPSAISFPGTRYTFRLGIAPPGEMDDTSEELSSRNLSLWNGTVSSVKDSHISLNLSPTEAERDTERVTDGSLQTTVEQLPKERRSPSSTVSVLTHWTYDAERTDETAVVPSQRKIPGTELTVDYKGRVRHENGRELTFSNGIKFAFPHETGALVLFKGGGIRFSGSGSITDPDKEVPEGREVARIDSAGELDWFVAELPRDVQLYFEELRNYDDRWFIHQDAGIGAEFDPDSGEVVTIYGKG